MGHPVHELGRHAGGGARRGRGRGAERVKTLATFATFAAKTFIFVFLYIWVRWTVPRFRYDQVMHLGWKVMLPIALGYVTLMAVSILVLDAIGMEFGFTYGLILTAINAVATGIFLWVIDRDRVISGAAARRAPRRAPTQLGAGARGRAAVACPRRSRRSPARSE